MFGKIKKTVVFGEQEFLAEITIDGQNIKENVPAASLEFKYFMRDHPNALLQHLIQAESEGKQKAIIKEPPPKKTVEEDPDDDGYTFTMDDGRKLKI